MVVGESTLETELLVVGSGPGGYAAAFRAADLGMDVTMVSQEARPGGVCLYEGCIPSKTLLYLAQLLTDAGRAPAMGITFGPPQIDLPGIQSWRDQVIGRLTDGLQGLVRRRDVQFIRAKAAFAASNMVRLQGADVRFIRYKHAILATGSQPVPLPGVQFRPGGRIMDSSAALTLSDIPSRLLVIGGGYIGLELGSIYAALGSRVTMVEMLDGLLANADRDLVQVLEGRLAGTFAAIHIATKVADVREDADGVDVALEGPDGVRRERYDRVLAAMGRRPNTDGLELAETRVRLTPQGFVRVDERMATADPAIYAVGDVVGGAMLAHKAVREGKVAAECIAGQASAFDARAVPAVVYTDPQIAWCGLTEDQARRDGVAIRVARFPWIASGRAVSMDACEGLTKIVADPETGRVLGMGIAGREAGELIAEGVLAVEMGALAEDMAFSIHPHPTLSETQGEVAELFLGTSTHYLPRKGH
jgi:dihydrolipoamide dehydrogenase